MINLNNNGDNGQPWQIPLEVGKKSEGVPLTSTTKQEEDIHPMLYLTPSKGIPIYKSTSL